MQPPVSQEIACIYFLGRKRKRASQIASQTAQRKIPRVSGDAPGLTPKIVQLTGPFASHASISGQALLEF